MEWKITELLTTPPAITSAMRLSHTLYNKEEADAIETTYELAVRIHLNDHASHGARGHKVNPHGVSVSQQLSSYDKIVWFANSA